MTPGGMDGRRFQLGSWLLLSMSFHCGVLGLVERARISLSAPAVERSAVLFGSSFEISVDLEEPSAQAASMLEGKGQVPPAEPQPRSGAPQPRSGAPQPRSVEPSSHLLASPKPESKPESNTGKRSPDPRTTKQSSAPSRAELGATPGAAAPSGAASEYGQEGGIRGASAQLRRAFIKTLPLAAKLDPTWLTLAPGTVGYGRFEIRLNEQGQLLEVRMLSGNAHVALIRAMDKNRVFLGSRRFSMSDLGRNVTLLVDVSGQVSVRAASEEAQDKVIALGVRIDPMDPTSEPTAAYWTYGNGQHVELTWRPVH